MLLIALKAASGSSLNEIAEYILTSSGVELKNGVNLLRLVKLQARQVVRNGLLVKTRDSMYRIARGPGRPSLTAPSKSKMVGTYPL